MNKQRLKKKVGSGKKNEIAGEGWKLEFKCNPFQIFYKIKVNQNFKNNSSKSKAKWNKWTKVCIKLVAEEWGIMLNHFKIQYLPACLYWDTGYG